MDDQYFSDENPIPEGFFQLEELEKLSSYAGEILVEINYYLWINPIDKKRIAEVPIKYLYALELIFDSGLNLLLSTDEDSNAIKIIPTAYLVAQAQQLQQLNGKSVIQRINAGIQPIWREVAGKILHDIQLNPNDEGLYYNDAILLHFAENNNIIVHLADRQGLVIGKADF